MRAAFLAGTRTIEVRDVADPGEEPGLEAVDVTSCGVCGSDLHGWRHPEQAITAGRTLPPGIAGHEVVGTVPGDAAGRRVVVEPNLAGSCGRCAACRAGTAWFCRERRPLPVWGFAERMYVRPESLFTIPDAVPDVVAALTEPLACAVHAFRASHTVLRLGGALEGTRVAVIGAGIAGLLTVAAAARMGASAVASVARYPHQARRAAELGATEVFDANGNEAEALRSFRADVVAEAVGGAAATFDLAVRSVVPGGEVIVLGLFDDSQRIDARRAVFRELRLFFPVTYSVLGGRHDFEVAFDLLAADPGVFAPLVTHRFSLDETGRAFATAADKSSGSLRVLVQP